MGSLPATWNRRRLDFLTQQFVKMKRKMKNKRKKKKGKEEEAGVKEENEEKKRRMRSSSRRRRKRRIRLICHIKCKHITTEQELHSTPPGECWSWFLAKGPPPC